MPLSAEGVQNVKAVLDGVTSEGRTGVPGLVFVAVDKAGKTLVEHASGTRGVNSKEKVDMDTTFCRFFRLHDDNLSISLLEKFHWVYVMFEARKNCLKVHSD